MFVITSAEGMMLLGETDELPSSLEIFTLRQACMVQPYVEQGAGPDGRVEVRRGLQLWPLLGREDLIDIEVAPTVVYEADAAIMRPLRDRLVEDLQAARAQRAGLVTARVLPPRRP